MRSGPSPPKPLPLPGRCRRVAGGLDHPLLAESFCIRSHGRVSTKRLHTTGDLTRHGIPWTVRCTGCGHEAELRGMALDQLCKARHWDRDLSSVRRRLKCGQFGSRSVEMLPHGEQRQALCDRYAGRLTETKLTAAWSKRSTSLAKSSSERVRRSTL